MVLYIIIIYKLLLRKVYFPLLPPPRNTLMSTFRFSYLPTFSPLKKPSFSCENNCQFTCIIREIFVPLHCD